MPHGIHRDIFLEVHGVNLSRFVRAARLVSTTEQRETTGIGAKHRTFVSGPTFSQLEVEWMMDYHPDTVYRTLYPQIGKIVRVQLQPFGGNLSATRPRHQFNVLLTEVPALSAAYGQLSTFQTAWPVSGDIGVTPRPYFRGDMRVGVAGGNTFGFVFDSTSDSFTYGRIVNLDDPNQAAPHVQGTEVPGFTPVPGVNVNIDLRQLTYNTTTGEMSFYLGSNADAAALIDHWLVAGPVVQRLRSDLLSTQFFRFPATNPTWVNGLRVTVELWNANPDPDA